MECTIGDGSARIRVASRSERDVARSSFVRLFVHSLARSLERSLGRSLSRCAALRCGAVPLRRAGRCATAYAPRDGGGEGWPVPRDAAGQSGARIAGVRHMAARRLREPQSQYVAVSHSGNTNERVVARACLRKERSR